MATHHKPCSLYRCRARGLIKISKDIMKVCLVRVSSAGEWVAQAGDEPCSAAEDHDGNTLEIGGVGRGEEILLQRGGAE